MTGVSGYGVYIPVFRIERQTVADQYGDSARGGEVTVPAHDEDVVTMAVTAGRNAVEHASADAGGLDAVYTASISDPFDERGLAPHVATALGAGTTTAVGDFAGSPRAATNALLAARDSIAAGRAESVLVVGSDVLSAAAGSDAEQYAGAGAAAVVLTTDGAVADLKRSAVNTTGFVGRFSRTGSSPVEGDRRFNRKHGYLDAVTGAIERLDPDPDRCALPSHADWGDRALGAADLDCERHTTFDDVGDVATASVLLDTALAFDHATPDETVLLASYGAGGSDAVVFEAGPSVDREPDQSVEEFVASKKYVPYGKHRAYREQARGGD